MGFYLFLLLGNLFFINLNYFKLDSNYQNISCLKTILLLIRIVSNRIINPPLMFIFRNKSKFFTKFLNPKFFKHQNVKGNSRKIILIKLINQIRNK